MQVKSQSTGQKIQDSKLYFGPGDELHGHAGGRPSVMPGFEVCDLDWRCYLSGETRKVETDRVAVGTFSGEGLSPVFQERAPWSIMDETNKAREHKKA